MHVVQRFERKEEKEKEKKKMHFKFIKRDLVVLFEAPFVKCVG